MSLNSSCSKMAKKKSKLKSTKAPVVNNQPAVDAANGESTPIVSVASSPIPMLAKVCRLCETKEGPFQYIFGSEKNTAQKIDELMPFVIAENDELPHKICFRCSAKVEELHEFVQKCLKTQENLYNLLGKEGPTSKMKHRSLWEKKLNSRNKTNDDICDAVIKIALEGLKDIISTDETTPTEPKSKSVASFAPIAKVPKAHGAETLTKQSGDDLKKVEPEKKNSQVTEKVTKNENSPAIELKFSIDKCHDKTSTKTRSSRSNNETPLLEGIPTRAEKEVKPSKAAANKNIKASTTVARPPGDKNVDQVKPNTQIKNTNIAAVAQEIPPPEEKVDVLPFNIMDHVSMIKVNGVGVLFQCKLCNRNFLNKEVVLSHWCAKNRSAKEDIIKKPAPTEPPRVATVKYINTKVDDVTKQQDIKSAPMNKEPTGEDLNERKKNMPQHKPKPKIGPASKVKKTSNDSISSEPTPLEPTPTQVKSGSVVQLPVVPSLNCRYKLVPGPNNTFTLVEAHTIEQKEESSVKTHGTKKRELPTEEEHNPEVDTKQRKVLRSENLFVDKGKRLNPEEIKLEDRHPKETASQPYPVGLFKTVNHSNNEKTPAPTVVPFATSTQKKQSYTIVQTGNPSKLLISAKPQLQKEEVPKKKQKKQKTDVPTVTQVQQQPFSVTLEDASHPKDSGFFTFINVDPLLQPSYVLPTDNNIVQEYQISTSNQQSQSGQNPGKSGALYSCKICNEKFTREQKLLVHINSHYNKLDEEEQMRHGKPSRKRGKKS